MARRPLNHLVECFVSAAVYFVPNPDTILRFHSGMGGKLFGMQLAKARDSSAGILRRGYFQKNKVEVNEIILIALTICIVAADIFILLRFASERLDQSVERLLTVLGPANEYSLDETVHRKSLRHL